MMKSVVLKNYRFNFIVNVFDGGFFGMALGFASFITILPLFVSQMTDSAILIGLIPAIHSVGWQLPQLFTANRVSRLERFKPMVMWMTVQERFPFLGLAVVAWLLTRLDNNLALVLTYFFLIWQGLGGGFTATAWQTMIAKIIPAEHRGTFFGFQSASANFLMSFSALFAGLILERLDSPLDFTILFLLASLCMGVSLIFIGMTKEDRVPVPVRSAVTTNLWKNMTYVLKNNGNFRWFLIVRMFSQMAVMAVAFYTVYAVQYQNMSEGLAGVMMAVYTVSQIIANPIMGWMGDRWNHPTVMKVGLMAAGLSALLAWQATSISWFYAVFFLAGIANVSIWTIGMAMTLEFGTESERPLYIGLANTLIAPSTILAPIIGGWLADRAGYPTTFLISALIGIFSAFLLHITLRDPRQRNEELPITVKPD